MDTSVHQNTSTEMLTAALVCNSSKLETIQAHINSRMDTYTSVYAYNRMLQSNENAHATTTHGNNGASREHNTR